MEAPEGSRFKIEPTIQGTQISWFDKERRTRSEIGGGLFVLFWLGGWACGEYFALTTIIEGWQKGEWNLFLLFWLCGWTVVGTFALHAVIKIFGPSKPTKLTLMSNRSICFEQGSNRKNIFIRGNGTETSTIVKSGKKYGLIYGPDIQNLRLERILEYQRLSFDYQSQRIEIGNGLTEPEREWLYEILKDHISS